METRADQPHIEVAEQQDEEDAAPADAEQQPGEVSLVGQVQPGDTQQHRHHQVVADHGADGDGGDDHHAGRGRQAADEGEEGEQLVALRHGNGQHEDVDGEKVEREQPDRLLDMGFVDVLDDRDLKLPRQADDGDHGQRGEREPGAVAAGGVQGEQPGHLRACRRLGENIGEAVVELEGDEDADREEGEQLDHRFEGDGCDKAFVVFAGVDVADAEQDREGRHGERNVKRRVLEKRQAGHFSRHDEVGVLQQHVEAGGDRLQLQRDVRHDADHRDPAHQAAQERRLAVARGDEVGD